MLFLLTELRRCLPTNNFVHIQKGGLDSDTMFIWAERSLRASIQAPRPPGTSTQHRSSDQAEQSVRCVLLWGKMSAPTCVLRTAEEELLPAAGTG